MSSYLEFETGVPVCFTYLRNEAKSPSGVVPPSIFAQEIEPAGQYFLVAETESELKKLVPGWVYGRVMVKSPLVIPFGDGYASPLNWKRVLSEKYQGLVGRALAKSVVRDGFDSIITIGEYKGVRSLSECVFLGTGRGQASLATNEVCRGIELETLLRLCSCKEANDDRYASVVRAHIEIAMSQPLLADICSAVELTGGDVNVIRQVALEMLEREGLQPRDAESAPILSGVNI